MSYTVTHSTTYRYSMDVSVSHHIVRQAPRAMPSQKVLAVQLDVSPSPAILSERTDYYGNRTAYFTVESPHRQLVVTTRSTVELQPVPRPKPAATTAWEKVRAACSVDLLTSDSEAGELIFDSPHVPRSPEYAKYTAESFPAGRPILDGVVDYIARIFRDFAFDKRATTVATPVDEVFRLRRGVCQDFAHFAIAGLRSLGLPARYVSGYLETLPPPGKPRLIGADASHAWLSVWCGEHGWIDADPTNNLLPGDRHITLAWGRDYSDVSPHRGVVVGGGNHKLQVSVDVLRSDEPLKKDTD